MRDRGRHSLRPRNWFTVLVALLFAINLPLSAGFAALVVPERGPADVPAMSCHEPATAQPQDEDKPSSLQHLCCFTACIPLAAAADATIALALPVGEPMLSLLPTRPLPRAIGVDPPPPRR
ncbi:MAG: hypothetical protein KF889_18045 [Alphaproteobacteria bacterium]|nr:hypothetical protein [Alphaproteobacteria bacterium]MCW5741355.1 hypothetical protein [Alphaproteobacteria bacterium]